LKKKETLIVFDFDSQGKRRKGRRAIIKKASR